MHNDNSRCGHLSSLLLCNIGSYHNSFYLLSVVTQQYISCALCFQWSSIVWCCARSFKPETVTTNSFNSPSLRSSRVTWHQISRKHTLLPTVPTFIVATRLFTSYQFPPYLGLVHRMHTNAHTLDIINNFLPSLLQSASRSYAYLISQTSSYSVTHPFLKCAYTILILTGNQTVM